MPGWFISERGRESVFRVIGATECTSAYYGEATAKRRHSPGTPLSS